MRLIFWDDEAAVMRRGAGVSAPEIIILTSEFLVACYRVSFACEHFV